jgi:hypothetical protein
MDSGSGERGLQLTRPYDYKRNIRLHVDYRLCLAGLNLHWLAPPAPSWCGHTWSWTPALEIGGVLAVLARFLSIR